MGKTGTTVRDRTVGVSAAPRSDPQKPVSQSGLLAIVDRLSAGWVVFALIGLSCLAYANSLGGDFVFDDSDQVVANHDIRSWNNLGRAFTTHVWAFRERPDALRLPIPPPYYRPIFTVLLTVEYQVFGLWPQGWHLVSLLLHILCSVGVFYVLLLISRRNAVAAVAAMLFAVYPIHVESVSWISGVTDPLLGAFFLWSFYFYLEYRVERQQKQLALSIVLFLFAAFSKETALSLIPLLFVYELIESRFVERSVRKPLSSSLLDFVKPVLPFAAVGVLYVIARYLALGGLTWKTGYTYEGPFVHTLFTLPSVLWAYLTHLIWPVDLSIAYFTSFVTSALSPRFLLPVIPFAILAVVIVAYRKRMSRDVWIALALLIIPLLPVLDLRNLSIEYLVFDRYLYLSVSGWSYLLALGLARLAQIGASQTAKHSKYAMVFSSGLLVVLVVALTIGTARENRNWADDYSLWSQAARIRPDFWPGHYNAGREMMEAKRFDEAHTWLQRAADLAPNEPAIFDTLGKNYIGMGDTRSATASFNRAIAIDPTMFESLNSLGQIHFKEKNYTAAETMFNAALKLKPQAFAPRFDLGLCFAEQGNCEEAVRHFEQAAAISRDDAEAWYQLALAYEKTNRAADAISALERGSAHTRSPELAQKMSEATVRLQNK